LPGWFGDRRDGDLPGASATAAATSATPAGAARRALLIEVIEG